MMRQRMTKDEVFTQFGEHVSSGKAKYFKQSGLDFVLGRREGARMWDLESGHELINCHCNGGVFNLGHRHPEILYALENALRYLDIGNHHLVSEQRARLGKQLAQLAPGNLTYSVFGVSGGEAIDTAIKIARKATGRRKVLSVEGGYHGHTGLALAAGADKFSEPFLSTSDDFAQVPFNDVVALQAALDDQVAAVLIETIPATSGILVPDPDYLPAVRRLCDRTGTLYIADEVQTGLGRTGLLWGVDHYRVVPDIMVLGKGLSGGLYPITATMISEKLEAVFHDDPFLHISTFGGAEIGCAVAGRVLELSSDAAFLRRVQSSATRLRTGLDVLQHSAAPYFQEVRGMGLMIGLKMMSPELGMLMCKMTYDAGLFCVFSGLDPAVVQFLPPLIADDHLIDEILERLSDAFRRLRDFAGGGK